MLISIVLVLFHAMFMVFSFFFFRRQLRKVLHLEETEVKLSGFIANFNNNAEINLRLLEQKEASLRVILRQFEVASKNIARTSTKVLPKAVVNKELKALSKSKRHVVAEGGGETTLGNIASTKHVGIGRKIVTRPSVKAANANKVNDEGEEKTSRPVDSKVKKKVSKPIKKSKANVKTSFEELKQTSTAKRAFTLYREGNSLLKIAKELSIDITEAKLLISLEKAEQTRANEKRKKMVASKFLSD